MRLQRSVVVLLCVGLLAGCGGTADDRAESGVAGATAAWEGRQSGPNGADVPQSNPNWYYNWDVKEPTRSQMDFFTKLSDRIRAMSSCMEEKGWEPFELDHPDTVQFVWAEPEHEGREAEFEQQMYECSLPLGPGPGEYPIDEDYANRRYDAFLRSRECLVEQGFTTLAEPPSREAFVASVLAKDLDMWFPADGFRDDPKSDSYMLNDLYDMCPWMILDEEE